MKGGLEVRVSPLPIEPPLSSFSTAVDRDNVVPFVRTQAAVDPTRVVAIIGTPVAEQPEARPPDPQQPAICRSMDLKKEKNFFEARVIEYQNGGTLSWE